MKLNKSWMKNRLIIAFLLITTIILVGCQKEITSQDAIDIAKNFVDNQVKVIVDDNGTKKPPERVVITIVDLQSQKIGGIDNYVIILDLRSNETGEEKKKGLQISIDKKTGQINNVNQFFLDN